MLPTPAWSSLACCTDLVAQKLVWDQMLHPSCTIRKYVFCSLAYVDSEDPDQPEHLQSDQDLQFQLTESLDTTECMNGEQRAGCYFVHVQDNLNLHILHMFKSTF